MSLRICFVGILVSALAALLSELGFRQKRLLVTLSLVILLSMLADGIGKLFSSVLKTLLQTFSANVQKREEK